MIWHWNSDVNNRSTLHELLSHKDLGLRYWGMVGSFLLNDDDVPANTLTDSSHEIRILAAWLLIKQGKKKQGQECLRQLIKENSYTMLTVLNTVDWIGDDAVALMPEVTAYVPKKKSYEERMRTTLMEKYSGS